MSYLPQGFDYVNHPWYAYPDTQANIEAYATPLIGMYAYATDIKAFGCYNGTSWDWDKLKFLLLDCSNDPLTGDLDFSDGHGIDTVDFIDLRLAATPTTKEGRINWNVDDGVPEVGMPGGNVKQQIGQELFVPRRVKNNTGADMTNGQLIYISGGDGSNAYVALAKADAEATSAFTIAMLTEDIANGHYGYATLIGMVRDVNTAAYDPGTPLYLSAATAGAYTDTRPTAPNHGVFIGTVFRKHATEGSIIVSIQNGYEYSELHDVYAPSPIDGSMPLYIAANSRYELFTSTAAGRALLDDADATAQRTTLGLIAGGAGDIWVEKAGDTMTGALTIRPATDTLTALIVDDKDSNRIFTVDSINNRVGIGVSTLPALLSVQAPAAVTNIGGTTTANATKTITGVGTTFTTSLSVGDRISLSSASTTYATVLSIASDTSLTVSANLGNGTSQTINKQEQISVIKDTAGASKIYIDALGRIGLGGYPANATGNASVLQLFSDAGGGMVSYSANSTASVANVFTFGRARGTIASPTAVSSGDAFFSIFGGGHDGSNYASTAKIVMECDGTVSTGVIPARIGFYTSATNAASMVERMRITSGGLVGIGVTPTARLHVLGSTDIIQLQVTGHSTQAAATPMAQIIRSSSDTTAGIRAMLGLDASGDGNNGTGGALVMAGKSYTTAAQTMAQIEWPWTDSAHATQTTDLVYKLKNAGSLGEVWRMTGAGRLDGVKAGITEEGGFYVVLVAGENLSRGEVVSNSTTTDGRVVKNPIDGDMPWGVVYADATSGNQVKVVTDGIAYVLPESGITAARGNVIYSSDAEAGRVDQAASVPAALTHWREIGHFVDTGSGNGALTRAIIHQN